MTSPHVTAPIDTSTTTGAPFELGMPIASGFVPASFGPPGGPSRGGEVAVSTATSPPSASRRTQCAEHPRRERLLAHDDPRPLGRIGELRPHDRVEHEIAERTAACQRSNEPSASTVCGCADGSTSSVSSHSTREKPWPSLPRASASAKCANSRCASSSENPRARRRASASSGVHGAAPGRTPETEERATPQTSGGTRRRACGYACVR